MRYLLLIYRDEAASESRTPEQIREGIAAHAPYIEALRRNGRYAGGEALAGAESARVLRGAGGKVVATDGPFAECREQLGGFYLIEARDLDQAIAAASACPALRTVGVGIEIRPVAAQPVAGGAEPASHLIAIYSAGALDGFAAWAESLRGAGALWEAAPLAAAGSATTLRPNGANVALADGPFDEARDPIAGYALVRARDLDEAARLAPAWPGCAVEVRPVRRG